MSRSSGRDFRSLSELLDSGNLASLTREAARRRELTARIRDLLPAEEAAHVVSAGTNDAGELVLMMDSAAWAARVRFHAEALGVERVRVRVAPGGRAGQPGTS